MDWYTTSWSWSKNWTPGKILIYFKKKIIQIRPLIKKLELSKKFYVVFILNLNVDQKIELSVKFGSVSKKVRPNPSTNSEIRAF